MVYTYCDHDQLINEGLIQILGLSLYGRYNTDNSYCELASFFVFVFYRDYNNRWNIIEVGEDNGY